jgi:hypothetical protein
MAAVAALLALAHAPSARAISLDRAGSASLGLRAYTAVRLGTEAFEDLSYPPTAAGHLRQHRYFLEVELKHKLTDLIRTTNSPLAVFRHLPFPTDRLSYTVAYRGEGEGLYDYGPRPFTTFDDYKTFRPDLPAALQPSPEEMLEFGREIQRRARRVARQRHQLFLAFADIESGPVFVRIGRQNLSWGEMDVFRLLDNINPLDNGFGSFFIPLDERRIPLDMVRTNVSLPDLGPVSQGFLEGFAGLGDRVAFEPGIPIGSPWNPGGLNFPLTQSRRLRNVPDLSTMRFGGRLVFNLRDVTFSIAQYWTFLDTPHVKNRVQPGVPAIDNRVISFQAAPRVPITGASMSFALPRWHAVVRSEFAYFHGAPANCQGIGTADQAMQDPNSTDPAVQRNLRRLQRNLDSGCLDPLRYPGFGLSSTPLVSDRLKKDAVNLGVGLDVNRYVRWLNRQQSLFITTQFFYKHIVDAFPDQVLPVLVRTDPLRLRTSPFTPLLNGRHLDLIFARERQDQFLQTLSLRTSYRGGMVQPSFNLFYDWTGVWLYQPGLHLVRDPFRVVVDYTGISGVLGGEIGLLRDRDTVRFQLEVAF